MIESPRVVNLRPTDARIRTVRIVAADKTGPVAHGRTDLTGSAEDSHDVVAPGADADGTYNETVVADEVRLALQVNRGVREDQLLFRFEVESYDQFYRVASEAEARRYTTETSPGERKANELLPARNGIVRLGTREGQNICLTNDPLNSQQEAASVLSLPFPVPKEPPTFVAEDQSFLVRLELADWPDWSSITKSGRIVRERPLQTASRPTPSVPTGWEFCADDLQGRILSVHRLPDTSSP